MERKVGVFGFGNDLTGVYWTHANITSVLAFRDDLNPLKCFCLLGFADRQNGLFGC